MCILFLYMNPKPKKDGYRLIICANRDEFYRRPAKHAFKCENTGVIGGRDMEQGRENGMWLGITCNKLSDCKFRFGALLNVTGEKRKSGVHGRGSIVADYLSGKEFAPEYNAQLQNDGATYNAFNFVAVEVSDSSTKAYHLSNAPVCCDVYEGIHVLGAGNSTAKSPLQKVLNGKKLFGDIISNYNDISCTDTLITELLNLLKSEEKHLPDPELDKRAPNTVEQLSSIYVKFLDAGYGTRTHSLILIDANWNVQFIEDTMVEPIDPLNPTWNRVNLLAHL